MISSPAAPLSGYLIENVYVVRQHQHFLSESEGLPDGDPPITFGWDWQIETDEPEFFNVALTVGIVASKVRPEEAEVHLIGRFRFGDEGSAHTVNLTNFVTQNAPAILFPYARAILAGLTTNSFLGVYHFPPMNVLTLMEDQDPSDATGAKQLRDDSALARRLGVNVQKP